MKKHYTFVPLKDNELMLFRKALMSSLWFRPVFCILALLFLGWLGFSYRFVLTASPLCLIWYTLAVLFVLSEAYGEIRRLSFISHLKKSALLPYFHASKAD